MDRVELAAIDGDGWQRFDLRPGLSRFNEAAADSLRKLDCVRKKPRPVTRFNEAAADSRRKLIGVKPQIAGVELASMRPQRIRGVRG